MDLAGLSVSELVKLYIAVQLELLHRVGWIAAIVIGVVLLGFLIYWHINR